MSTISHSHSEVIDPVLEELGTVQQRTGHDYGTIFRDWLDLLVAAFASDDDRHGTVLDGYDELGVDVQTVAERYSRAMAELVLATEAYQHDVLGDVYTALGNRTDALGQHFTPHNVADAKARMLFTVEDMEASAGRAEHYHVGDPACGSGRLLVAAGKAIHHLVTDEETGLDGDDLPPLVFAGKDLDETCAKMTAVNFVLGEMAGIAVHGNSLTDETYSAWKNRPGRFPPLVETGHDPFTAALEAQRTEADAPDTAAPVDDDGSSTVQLSLREVGD